MSRHQKAGSCRIDPTEAPCLCRRREWREAYLICCLLFCCVISWYSFPHIFALEFPDAPVHGHDAPEAKPGDFLLDMVGTRFYVSYRVIGAFVRICSFTVKAELESNSAPYSHQMPHACIVFRSCLQRNDSSIRGRYGNILAEVSCMELLMRY